jgi:threonine dehydrogenase-like Zn-dependent dehydrogenase
MYSLCENSNPNAWLAEKLWGHAPAGIYGSSHLTGGYAGGQAEYARIAYADTNPIKVPEGLDDEQVLFLSDILPTGWMAAENCDLEPGDTVAVWGCGPVGLFAMISAKLQGAERVIGIDCVPERLRMASENVGAETLSCEDTDILEALEDLTGGRGPDACIDAVGMEAHVHGVGGVYDRAKQVMKLEGERPMALRDALRAVRNGGHVSVPGMYGGSIDKVPFGSVMNRSVTIKTGQTHVQRYMQPLLERIENHEIDPTFIITHRVRLDDAPAAYRTFREKADQCVKVVMTP